MKKLTFILLLFLPFLVFSQQNNPPKVTNLSVYVNTQADTLKVSYDLADAENNPCNVSVFIVDTTANTAIKVTGATGDIGDNIVSGTKKKISWNYTNGVFNEFFFKIIVVADDGKIPTVESILKQVDGDRMMKDLKFLAQKPRHRTSNPAHLEACRDSIQKLFIKTVGSSSYATFLSGNYTGKNIVSVKNGAVFPKKNVILDAHYDTVSSAPGADDNGSGVIGVMEASRILSQYSFKKSIQFIAFDMEEDGLLGSKAYTKNLKANTIENVLNFEMIGFYNEQPNAQTLPTGFNILFPAAYAAVEKDSFKGNFITNVGNVASNDLITAFNDAASKYVPSLKVVSVAVPGTGTVAPDLRRSDHASFWDKNIKSLMLSDGANFRNANYHTKADTIGTINKEFLTNVVKATLATVINLAELDHSGSASLISDLTVGTKNVETTCDFQLQPNPSKDYLFLNRKNCAEKILYTEIYDLSGKLLAKRVFTNENDGVKIDIQTLNQGVYLLKTNIGSKQFVKQ